VVGSSPGNRLKPTPRALAPAGALPRADPLRALADRFGVSKHTITRDVDALARVGIPVEEERRGEAVLFFVRREGR
jgi:DNA-binding GntR family transcriptional regulator